MSFQLRDYQEDMIKAARAELRVANSVLIQSPTGSGKTNIAAYMTSEARRRGLRAWFLCHRDFLLQQTSLTYDKIIIPHSFIAAGGYPYNPDGAIQICSVATLRRRLEKLKPPHLIMWDECHHCEAATYQVIRDWAGRHTKHVGFSATPERLDGKGLDGSFERMVHGPSVADLIQRGYLSDYRCFAPSTPDMTGIRVRAGDYSAEELERIMDTSVIVGDMVGHYLAYAKGLRAVYFCVSVLHSQKVAAAFNASGVPALHLDGTSPTKDRMAAARAFARGELQVLTNVDLFGEGYDLAAQAGQDVAIDCVGLGRPTKSLPLYLQQVGRSLRPSPGKKYAVILDHAGNTMRHGLPDEDRQWSLSGKRGRTKGSESGPPVRQCPECFAVHSAAAFKCPHCEYVYDREGRAVEEVAGDLQELDVAAIRKAKKQEQGRAQSLEDLIDLAKRRGYKNPEKWASFIWTKREAMGQQRAEDQARQYKMW